MSIAEIRNQLHLYINNADEDLLALLYKIASQYPDMKQAEHSFSATDMAEFERRRQSRIAGASATFSLEEVMQKLKPEN